MQPGYSRRMRGVMLEVPEWLLEQRAAWGGDRRDEVWDGVLHMVPEPTLSHNNFEYELHKALEPVARRRGLRVYQQVAIRDPEREWKNYRRPDLVIVRPENVSEAAVDGPAEVAIEILSPNDESREKLPFYAERGVVEVWLIDPLTREFDVLVRSKETYEPVPAVDGVVRSAVGVALSIVEGPRLLVATDLEQTLV
jgi:Uma2 family endonuclease